MDSRHSPQVLVPDSLMRQLALKILSFAAITAPVATAVILTQDRPYELAIGISAVVVGLWLMRNALSTTLLVISLLLITFISGISFMFGEGTVTTALVIVQVPLLLLTMNLNKWAAFSLVIACIALLQVIGFAYPEQVTPAPWSSIVIAILFTTFFTQTLPLIIRNHLKVIAEKNAQLDGIETALNNADIGLEIVNPSNSEYLYVSQKAAQISGMPANKLIGKQVNEIDPNYPADVFATLIEDLKNEKSRVIETEHQRPSGQFEPLEISLSLVKDADGEPYRLFALTRSISDRKAYEDALKSSLDSSERSRVDMQNYLMALDYAQIGFEIVDPETAQYLYVNTTAASTSGHNPLKMLDMTVPEIDPNFSLEQFHGFIDRLFKSPDLSDVIRTHHKSSDSSKQIPLEIHTYLEVDKDGKPSRLFAFTRNIEAQVEAEKLLANEKDHLEYEIEKRTGDIQKLLQVKTEFMANMSHEIRTPMHAIIAMSNSLSEQLSEPDLQREATIVHRTAKSLLHLLDDILDSSKLDSGKLLLAPRDHQFSQLISDILEEQRPLAIEKNLYLELQDRTRNDLWVHVDDNRMRQIIKNLVSNAIKFTDSGGVTLKVESNFFSDLDEGWVEIVIKVKDTGPGIDLETQKRLFNRFEQADRNTSRKHGGSGLGLVIARDLARLMDGDITIHSRPMQGTTFAVTLKLPLGSKQGMTQRSNTALSGHVLIVDDVEVNRLIAAQIVKQLGLTSEEVESGYDAIDRIRETHFDAVLMDIQMPQIDGLDTTRLIREYEQSLGKPAVPVIAVTAHAMAEDKDAAMQAGMNDYLTKPFGKDELRDKLIENGLAPVNAAPEDAAEDGADMTNHAISKDLLVWDKTELAARLGEDEQMICLLMNRFFEELEVLTADLHLAANAKVADDVRKAAHSIKGAARSVSAYTVAEKALELENVAKDNVSSLFPRFVQELDDEIEKLKEETKCLELSA